MKAIDLARGTHSLSEILSLAEGDALLIRTKSGDDFLLERADEFDREIAALGKSDKFVSFLKERSRETDDIALAEVRKKRRL